LSQLRSLNWLAQEIRRVPPGSLECIHLQEQISAVRARLPNSILNYHDLLASRGQSSAVPVSDQTRCSACQTKLPSTLLDELAGPRRFGVCPNCGVFLWSNETSAQPLGQPGEAALPPSAAPAPRISPKDAHA
jgi:hypothetical protein